MSSPITRNSTSLVDTDQFPTFNPGTSVRQSPKGPRAQQKNSGIRYESLRTGHRPDNSSAGNPLADKGHEAMTHHGPHWQTTDRDSFGLMSSGETIRGNDVINTIERHHQDIEEASAKYGVDSNLVRATIYEEQTHQMPFEGTVEYYSNVGNTVGLGQMTVGNHGYTREQLLDSRNNIYSIAEHYSQMDPSFSVEEMATKYNGSGPKAEMYGRRVENFYNEFATQSARQVNVPDIPDLHADSVAKPNVEGTPNGLEPDSTLNTDVPRPEFKPEFKGQIAAQNPTVGPQMDEELNYEKQTRYEPKTAVDSPVEENKIGPTFGTIKHHPIPGQKPGVGGYVGIGIRNPLDSLPTMADVNQALDTAGKQISQGWNTVKDLASDAWATVTDFASESWQNVKQGINWVGDKIRENAQIDRPSVLERRDAEKGIKGISLNEAWSSIKETLGIESKPPENSEKKEKKESGENTGANGGQVSGADKGVGHNDLPDSF